MPPCPLLWHRRAFRELQLLQIIRHSDDYPDPLAVLILTTLINVIKKREILVIKYDNDDHDD